MTNANPAEAIETALPVEAIARALVLALLPALEAAMLGGIPFAAVKAQAWDRCWQDWRARYGDEVTIRAREILRQVGPAAILTPYGREVFIREHPVEGIALAAMQPGSVTVPTPVEGIGSWFRQTVSRFYKALSCLGIPEGPIR